MNFSQGVMQGYCVDIHLRYVLFSTVLTVNRVDHAVRWHVLHDVVVLELPLSLLLQQHLLLLCQTSGAHRFVSAATAAEGLPQQVVDQTEGIGVGFSLVSLLINQFMRGYFVSSFRTTDWFMFGCMLSLKVTALKAYVLLCITKALFSPYNLPVAVCRLWICKTGQCGWWLESGSFRFHLGRFSTFRLRELSGDDDQAQVDHEERSDLGMNRGILYHVTRESNIMW